MNDKVKAFALATSLLASPAAEAWHGGYYGGYNDYAPQPLPPSSSSQMLNTSACVGIDRIAMKSIVDVTDFSGNAQNRNNAISAVRNRLQNEWNMMAYQGQPDMLANDFQWAAQNVASDIGYQYGVGVQIYPQGVNYVQGGCSNGNNYYNYPPPRHHHHHRGYW